MILRQAIPDDGPAVRLLAEQAARAFIARDADAGFLVNIWSEAEYASVANGSGLFWLAEEAGSVLAFYLAVSKESPPSPSAGRLNTLCARHPGEQVIYFDQAYVTPAARGRGLARRLYLAIVGAVARAPSTFYGDILESPVRNSASARFHTSQGWRRVTALPATVDGHVWAEWDHRLGGTP